MADVKWDRWKKGHVTLHLAHRTIGFDGSVRIGRDADGAPVDYEVRGVDAFLVLPNFADDLVAIEVRR